VSDPRLQAIRDLIQQDPNNRGLRSDPAENLVTACAGDFEAACASIAQTQRPVIGVVTGFYITDTEPPCGETDGPPGALFLARALAPLGIEVQVATDSFSRAALDAGLAACRLPDSRHLFTVAPLGLDLDTLTHLIALERVGPSHHDDHCYSMRGRDVTSHTSPAHLLFEDAAHSPSKTTIGIGDGGNEIGMGKIPREVIERNIPRGDLIACRVPADHLIVTGVSNWGSYGLAAGVRLLRGAPHDPALFDPRREEELLQLMVEKGPLVDGMSGQPTATVDGLPFDRYARVLEEIGRLLT
jgi:hypothetical protein